MSTDFCQDHNIVKMQHPGPAANKTASENLPKIANWIDLTAFFSYISPQLNQFIQACISG